jgi:hypothetical protein
MKKESCPLAPIAAASFFTKKPSSGLLLGFFCEKDRAESGTTRVVLRLRLLLKIKAVVRN